MYDFELDLAEVAALLDYPRDAVLGLVERGVLLAAGTGNSLRISIGSVAHYVGVAADKTAVLGVQRVLQDPIAWKSVFESEPKLSFPVDFESFPKSMVGNSLVRAVEIASIQSA